MQYKRVIPSLKIVECYYGQWFWHGQKSIIYSSLTEPVIGCIIGVNGGRVGCTEPLVGTDYVIEVEEVK